MDACGLGVFWKIWIWKILMISWKLSSGDDDGHVRGGGVDRDRGGDHGHSPKKAQHIG